MEYMNMTERIQVHANLVIMTSDYRWREFVVNFTGLRGNLMGEDQENSNIFFLRGSVEVFAMEAWNKENKDLLRLWKKLGRRISYTHLIECKEIKKKPRRVAKKKK